MNNTSLAKNYFFKKRVFEVLRYLLVVTLVVICLFPVVVMVVTSLKERKDIYSWPPILFAFKANLNSYIRVFKEDNLLRYFMNSLIVGLSSTFLAVAVGVFAGYGLARFRFMGKKLFSYGMLFFRMVPPVIMVIPLFILWMRMGIIGTRTGLIIAYVAINIPFNIWILETFIARIPKSLEESASIDGCGELTILLRIILPLLTPALAVASIFTFRIAWNEFILGLVMTSRFTRTLPVVISLYITDMGVEWGPITAIAVIISIPAFIFTFCTARSLITGLTAGAVKG